MPTTSRVDDLVAGWLGDGHNAGAARSTRLMSLATKHSQLESVVRNRKALEGYEKANSLNHLETGIVRAFGSEGEAMREELEQFFGSLTGHSARSFRTHCITYNPTGTETAWYRMNNRWHRALDTLGVPASSEHSTARHLAYLPTDDQTIRTIREATATK